MAGGRINHHALAEETDRVVRAGRENKAGGSSVSALFDTSRLVNDDKIVKDAGKVFN